MGYPSQVGTLTLFLLAVPDGTVYQKIRFQLKKGSSIKNLMIVATMSRDR